VRWHKIPEGSWTLTNGGITNAWYHIDPRYADIRIGDEWFSVSYRGKLMSDEEILTDIRKVVAK
jgi:hypothetical protein